MKAENTEIENKEDSFKVSYHKGNESVELTNKKKSKTSKKRKNYAGSARDKRLHTRFKELPGEETLIDYYVCSLAPDFFPLQGKIYITRNYFAFYSNSIGLINRILIPINTITNISKEKTSKIFVNSIRITTIQPHVNKPHDESNDSSNLNDTVYVFVNFISHDAVFTLMNSLWNVPTSANFELVTTKTDNNSGITLGNESDGGDGYTSDESSKISSELTGDNTSVEGSKEDLKRDLSAINEKVDELFEQHRVEEESKRISEKRIAIGNFGRLVAYKTYNLFDFLLPSGPQVIYTGLALIVLLMVSTLYLITRIIHVEERLMTLPARKMEL